MKISWSNLITAFISLGTKINFRKGGRNYLKTSNFIKIVGFDYIERVCQQETLRDRHEGENQANFTTWSKKLILKTPSLFEKQLALVYIHKTFKKILEVLG